MVHKVFVCPVCKAKFSTPEELKIHHMINHKDRFEEIEIGPTS